MTDYYNLYRWLSLLISSSLMMWAAIHSWRELKEMGGIVSRMLKEQWDVATRTQFITPPEPNVWIINAEAFDESLVTIGGSETSWELNHILGQMLRFNDALVDIPDSIEVQWLIDLAEARQNQDITYVTALSIDNAIGVKRYSRNGEAPAKSLIKFLDKHGFIEKFNGYKYRWTVLGKDIFPAPDYNFTSDDLEDDSYVYLIGEKDMEFVKIGISKDPDMRKGKLQGGNARPLVVLGVVPGGAELEDALHSRWVGDHERGEWFRPNQEILEYFNVKKA